ncbi:type II toxin-antitoxin system VapC family toxin [Natronospora cellulosivora (SeqCode)]
MLVSYIQEIRKKQILLYTSNYVIDETLTWLAYNGLHEKAIKVMELWKEAEKNQSLKTIWVDKDITDEAWLIFSKFADHKLSFTDCTSFAICKELGINKVFGFDDHFNILGFLLSPYQIHESKVSYDVIYNNS